MYLKQEVRTVADVYSANSLGWWFGFLESPYERDCYLGGTPKSRTTGPQTTNLPFVALFGAGGAGICKIFYVVHACRLSQAHGDLNRSDIIYLYIYIYDFLIELIRRDVPTGIFVCYFKLINLKLYSAEFLQIKSICRGVETSQGFPHLGLSFFVLFPQDLTNKPLEHTPHCHK